MSTDIHLKEINELKALSKFIKNIPCKYINDSSYYILIEKQYLLKIGQFKGKRKKYKKKFLRNKGTKEHLYYNIYQNHPNIKKMPHLGDFGHIIIKMNFID